jgi:hypothetical protein
MLIATVRGDAEGARSAQPIQAAERIAVASRRRGPPTRGPQAMVSSVHDVTRPSVAIGPANTERQILTANLDYSETNCVFKEATPTRAENLLLMQVFPRAVLPQDL